jgi:hypothetical protein
MSETINIAARQKTLNQLSIGVKRCASTAKAAFLIAGETVHSLFCIPVTNTKNKILKLNNEKLQILQDTFKSK